MKIVKKEEIQKPNEVYNLHIENDHNYIAEGVVVANCHGAKAAALMTMLTGPMSKIQIRWGISGTIPKEEYAAQSLLVGVGTVLNTIKASDLQEKGVLANCHVKIRQMVDHSQYNQYQDELKYLLTTTARLEYIAGMIHEISKTGNTLVLIDRVEPGKEIAALIPGAVFLSGHSKSSDRKEQYDSIAIVDNQTLVATYGIASTGISINRLFNIVLIEPGKSFVRVIQSIGRGLRKGHDKDRVTVYDISSTCKFSKRHLSKRKQYYTEANYEYSTEKVDWQSKK